MTNKPVRTVIVDDESGAITTLESLLRIYSWIEVVGTISDSPKAASLLAEMDPDLVFMDIQMPVRNGFEVIREMSELTCSPNIIFVTAFDQYAIQAIRYAAFDYLLKPVNPAELDATLERLKTAIKEETDGRMQKLVEKTQYQPKIKFNTSGGFILVNPLDIVYIKADWNYSELHLGPDRVELITQNIGTIYDLLPQEDFYRINRSTIINTAYLAKVSRKKRQAILFKEGTEFTFRIPLLNIRKLESFLSP